MSPDNNNNEKKKRRRVEKIAEIIDKMADDPKAHLVGMARDVCGFDFLMKLVYNPTEGHAKIGELVNFLKAHYPIEKGLDSSHFIREGEGEGIKWNVEEICTQVYQLYHKHPEQLHQDLINETLPAEVKAMIVAMMIRLTVESESGEDLQQQLLTITKINKDFQSVVHGLYMGGNSDPRKGGGRVTLEMKSYLIQQFVNGIMSCLTCGDINAGMSVLLRDKYLSTPIPRYKSIMQVRCFPIEEKYRDEITRKYSTNTDVNDPKEILVEMLFELRVLNELNSLLPPHLQSKSSDSNNNNNNKRGVTLEEFDKITKLKLFEEDDNEAVLLDIQNDQDFDNIPKHHLKHRMLPYNPHDHTKSSKNIEEEYWRYMYLEFQGSKYSDLYSYVPLEAVPDSKFIQAEEAKLPKCYRMCDTSTMVTQATLVELLNFIGNTDYADFTNNNKQELAMHNASSPFKKSPSTIEDCVLFYYHPIMMEAQFTYMVLESPTEQQTWTGYNVPSDDDRYKQRRFYIASLLAFVASKPSSDDDVRAALLMYRAALTNQKTGVLFDSTEDCIPYLKFKLLGFDRYEVNADDDYDEENKIHEVSYEFSGGPIVGFNSSFIEGYTRGAWYKAGKSNSEVTKMFRTYFK